MRGVEEAKDRRKPRREKSGDKTGEKHGRMGRPLRAKQGADHIPRAQGMGRGCLREGHKGALGIPIEQKLAVLAIW